LARITTIKRLGFISVLFTFALCALAQKQTVLTEAVVTSDLISLQPQAEVESYTLKVSGPDGVHFETQFSGLSAPFIELYDPNGNLLPDGAYTFELVAAPVIPAETKRYMLEARANGDAEALKSLMAEVTPDFDLVQSGYFRIHQGRIVTPAVEEMDLNGDAAGILPMQAATDENDGGGSPIVDQDVPFEAQTFSTDLIVQGSGCIGVDCTSSESFGFDTLRLKENNLRIKFQDTSSSGSFPTNDWELVANDTNNGGAERFSIEDVTNSKTPFTIGGNAPNNALIVEGSTGDIGLGTSNPAVELHIVDGDSPTLRLEQNQSSGFGAQTWDIAGNETNFFVRDVTNGSELPFKIIPGADDNALVIGSNNNIGMGAGTSPGASLYIKRSDGSAQLVVEETNGTAGARNLIDLINKGPTRIRFQNTDNSTNWTVSNDASGFIIDSAATTGEDVFVTNSGRFLIRPNGTSDPGLVLENNGNMTIGGTLTQNSNRNAKKDFEPINPQDVLTKVAELPLSKWTYKDDQQGARHLGPMAQDFADAFGLGHTREGIATLDMSGVALAAIQGLNERLSEKDRKIEEKDAAIQDLETRLQALENLVEKLAK